MEKINKDMCDISNELVEKYPTLDRYLGNFKGGKRLRIKNKKDIKNIIRGETDKALFDKYLKLKKEIIEIIEIQKGMNESEVSEESEESTEINDSSESVELLCAVKIDTPIEIASSCINKQKEKEAGKNIWNDSRFKDIAKLESNNVGEVGETFLESLCKQANIESSINGIKTKQKGGGAGDGGIKNETTEVKTARLGNGGSSSFQHELGEYPWKAKYMTFIDFTPNYIYLTIFPNFTEEFYKKSGNDKNVKCVPYFPSKTITQRKGNFNFKLDTTVNINESNVGKKFTLKITTETNCNDVREYINSVIP